MTASSQVKDLSVEELVRAFLALALRQDEAVLLWDAGETNRLSREMWAIEDELKSRVGDQRSALLPLYSHANPQVRLKAAEATLAVSPVAARQVLEGLREVNGPQRLDAGMTIRRLDDGTYRPS